MHIYQDRQNPVGTHPNIACLFSKGPDSVFKLVNARILTQGRQQCGAVRDSQRFFWQAFSLRHRHSATRSATQVVLQGSRWSPLQVEPGNAAMTGGECGSQYRMKISYSIGGPYGYRVSDARHLARLSMGRSARDHTLCPMLSPLEAIYAIDKRLHHLCPLWCILLF